MKKVIKLLSVLMLMLVFVGCDCDKQDEVVDLSQFKDWKEEVKIEKVAVEKVDASDEALEEEEAEITRDKAFKIAEETMKLPEGCLYALWQVETSGKETGIDIVGDKHLTNHAYGYFQIRQPAIDDVNRFYDVDFVNKAEELKGNMKMQVIYASAYLKFLWYVFDENWEHAISAYNLGIGGTRKRIAKFKNEHKKWSSTTYYSKYKKAIEEKAWLN